MNCWDHELGGQASVRAVAVCMHCGAGVCLEHASVRETERYRQNGVGSPSRLLPNSREISCAACAEASMNGSRTAVPGSRPHKIAAATAAR
ncbi:DUF2180 family protein [Ornithinimicrobium ciconiae]|uniref:DUF2180 family protein n=1 Tax=Ornithinimicrobium ciconiae TaxID=2594265 RepID=A0A516G9H4_9MICO|nr:DUF2180 family protein [Ornithinimicrobium ciconiae]QDO88142.1 DUF2180 family protein [Ornithinimicrobium ciconiae]